jgi:bud site selection protein 31
VLCEISRSTGIEENFKPVHFTVLHLGALATSAESGRSTLRAQHSTMSRFARRERPPAGFDVIEPTLSALEAELREKVNEPHEGLRKGESLWPIHQINWQRSRYVYDLYHIYKEISREVYDYCIRMKLVDAALMAKWKKPGYGRLCSTYVINSRNYKFGTVSICRVPKQHLAEGTVVEDPNTGTCSVFFLWKSTVAE